MHLGQRGLLLLLAVAISAVPAVAQDPPPGPPPDSPPEIPSLEDIRAGQAKIPDYIPMEFNFRIGVVADFVVEIESTTGAQQQIKTPLLLIDPRTGDIGVYAKNFPAKIVASSPAGNWVVGIAPSAAVEGTSGSRNKEAAISLNLKSGQIKLIKEFPIHSNFQAFFSEDDSNVIYYCVNEPAAMNKIVRYNLRSERSTSLSAEGNRFFLYGMKKEPPRGLWVEDPLSLHDFPVVNLLDLEAGSIINTVEFPGATRIIARPGGSTLLASVEDRAEASLGFFESNDSSFHQVEGLVLTRPIIRWAHKSLAVVAKESTATTDRFLWIDLATGEARELFSGYFKVGQWDISPDDDALVFVSNSKENPILFVVPLDPSIDVINQIRLVDVKNVSWLGCLNPPRSRGSWIDRLLPF